MSSKLYQLALLIVLARSHKLLLRHPRRLVKVLATPATSVFYEL